MVDAKPSEIIINNNKYYNANDLSEYDPTYFFGCSKTVRNILGKKKIDKNNYVYATFNKKTGWAMSADQSKPATKACLLLASKWVVENIPKMMPISNESKESIYEYPEAPAIILLDDEEKFRDDENKIVEIETRGERTSKGIYFLAKDVSEAFDMPNLSKTLLKEDRGYIEKVHYSIFSAVDGGSVSANKGKTLFITYKGMLKILFCSRTGRANKFVEWATETLFTIQMGTKEQKEELAAGIIGIPAKSLREVLKSSASSTPCIYRFALGTAKQLRKIMNLPDNIPDDYIIIKYGYTDDLLRRTSEHIKTYEKIADTNIELMEYVYIDPKFLSQAEVKIKEFFNDIEIPINYESFVELVAINPKHEKMIKQQFKYLHTEFSGSIRELVEKIEKLKTEHHMALTNKDAEIIAERHMCELLKTKHQMALMDKDAELLKTKHQMALMNKDAVLMNKDVELMKKDAELLKKDLIIAKHELANAQQKNELLEMKLLMKK